MRRNFRFAVMGVCFVAGTQSASAVVVFGSQERNTAAPAPGSVAEQGWGLQGQWGLYLGTPIGPNHFITAQHFGGNPAGSFDFRGTSYTIDRTWSGGTDGFFDVPGSDLRIWKVNGAFPAHAQLYVDQNEEGRQATVFGRGTARGAAVSVNGQAKGWQAGAFDSVQGWGTNTVADVGNVGPLIGEVLAFAFDATGGANEATITNGDSGGGVFLNDNGTWELAAINWAIDGPFNATAPTDAGSFFGAVFDRGGLYQKNGASWPITPVTDTPANQPAAFYSSRISTRAEAIYNAIQNASIAQRNFTVSGDYSVGDITVSEAVTVGDGTNARSLVANHVRAGTLDVRNNAKVTVRRNGTDSGASRVTSLLVGTTGVLDLNDNALVVPNGNLAAVQALVKKGRAGGAWNGKGIVSGEAKTHPNMGLGVVLNSEDGVNPMVALFDGLAVGKDDVLVKYTWNGDVNLNGTVDINDYYWIDRGFLARESGWRNGDFNYDGTVDLADYALIDAAYAAEHSSPPPPSLGSAAAVPEPGTISLLGLGAVGLLSRRRRRA